MEALSSFCVTLIIWNMKILKTCKECGKAFVASKISNKYCSKECANVVRLRTESKRKRKIREKEKFEEQNVKMDALYTKPFLTPLEVSVLLDVSISTVYRYFYNGTINGIRLRNKTFVRREDIDCYFEKAVLIKKGAITRLMTKNTIPYVKLWRNFT